MDLSFKLEAFEGPLDLLLHLIDKNKVDIYDIPISLITDQYMEHVSKMGRDAEAMSQFLVMAATLLDIKAKMLLPKEENEDGNEEDPRTELVQKLLEYKLYKYMSYELKNKETDASKFFYKQQEIPDEVKNYVAPIDLDEMLSDVTLERLKNIFEDVMRRSREKVNEEAVRYGKIKREEISLPEKLDFIKKKVSSEKKVSFRKLIEGQKTRNNIIVSFLAILELMKNGEIVARQEPDDEIMLYTPDEAPEENYDIPENQRIQKKLDRMERQKLEEEL